MNITAFKNVATQGVGRSLFLVKKASPQILTAAGIVGGITAAVMGAKATLELEPVVDKLNEGREQMAKNKLQVTSRGEKLYTEKQQRHDSAYIYTRFGLSIAKLYGPAAAVGSASIVCVLSAQSIMTNRNAALLAGFTAVDKAFQEYRKRVETEIGSDREREIRFDTTPERFDDTAKGTVSDVLRVDNPAKHSPYARFFDQTCSSWERRADYNKAFLSGQQEYFNQMLVARGHVFLNEVYDALGIDRTPAGSQVGWTLDGSGDGYIDFGIYNFRSEPARAFVNGLEDSILLDFNVEGPIWNKI